MEVTSETNSFVMPKASNIHQDCREWPIKGLARNLIEIKAAQSPFHRSGDEQAITNVLETLSLQKPQNLTQSGYKF